MLEIITNPNTWPSPAAASLDVLKKVGQIAARPIDSRGLGQRLQRDHEQNQVQTGMNELLQRADEPEVAMLGGRQVLAVMARGLEKAAVQDPTGVEDRVLFIEGLMYDHFWWQTFDDFKLRQADIAALRRYVPGY